MDNSNILSILTLYILQREKEIAEKIQMLLALKKVRNKHLKYAKILYPIK